MRRSETTQNEPEAKVKTHRRHQKQQAGAELGQAPIKLELEPEQIVIHSRLVAMNLKD